MSELQIRPFREGEEPLLREVFSSSVFGVACSRYSPAQLAAWAPLDYDEDVWISRLRRNRPWIAERSGVILGFADLQLTGYIDHFFVSATAAGTGVGGALMRHLLAQAKSLNIAKLTSHVSLNAQPFFQHFGFEIEAEQDVTVRGVVLRNARMFKILRSDLPVAYTQDVTEILQQLLRTNRGPNRGHPDQPMAQRYGVAAVLQVRELTVTLTFRAGESYCCAEWGCHLPFFTVGRWDRFRAALSESGVNAPVPLTLHLTCIVEAGALLFDFTKPDKSRRGSYELAAASGWRYEETVCESI